MSAVACTHTDTDRHLLTAGELQERLRIGRDAVRELVRSGMPVIRIGQRRRFDWGDVVRWLREHNTQGE